MEGLIGCDDGICAAVGDRHIGIQQRNGRKTLTTVQGLDKAYDPKKILKAFKKASLEVDTHRFGKPGLIFPTRLPPRRNSLATATSSPTKKPNSVLTLPNPLRLPEGNLNPTSDRSSSCKVIRGTR